MHFFTSGALIFGLGLITSYTDLRSSKIYNKHLAFFLLASALIFGCMALLGLESFNRERLISLSTNVLVAFALAFFIYSGNLWTAGDAKLFTVYSFLVPFEFFGHQFASLFASFSLFMNVFALALLYLVLDTAICFAQEIHGARPAQTWALGKPTRATVLDYFLKSAAVISTVSILNLAAFQVPILRANMMALRLILFIATLVVFRRIVNKRFYLASSLLGLPTLLFIITSHRLSYASLNLQINFKLWAVMPFLLLLKYVAQRYDIQEIAMERLAEGMRLAMPTMIRLSAAGLSGAWLDPNFRLGTEDVAQIKRLSPTLGDKVVIQRRLPFAPLMFIGVLIQLAARRYAFA